jgi:glycerol kinase
MQKKYILALDSGTVKNRAVVFDQSGNIVSYAKKKLSTYYPHPGWIEQDADEIWGTQIQAAMEAIKAADINKADIAAVAITNQRETTIVWNRFTGRPVYRAISWQSRQTEGICERMKEEGLQEEINQKTSLVLNPYFSGTKLRWIFENVPGALAAAKKGDLLFGTVDTWLMWKLSGGRVFATDYSNASRTMMFNLRKLKWDKQLLRHFGVPASMLPEVLPSSAIYGQTDAGFFGREIPIAGDMGNQQADLFGQACFKKGMAKNSFGEGSFFLMNAGHEYVHSKNGLISTIAWGIGDEITYALEGSIFVSGATLEWLKDSLGILTSMSESEWVAKSVHDTDGVYFVPAFRGLSAPYWDTQTTGMIIGLKESTQKAHIIRAALFALAYQVRDVYEAIRSDIGKDLADLRVDGGASRNNLLMQFQADILGIPVIRPHIEETTSLGVAYMAGLATGIWKDTDELASIWQEGSQFKPKIPEAEREPLYDGWQTAVSKVMGWSGK